MDSTNSYESIAYMYRYRLLAKECAAELMSKRRRTNVAFNMLSGEETIRHRREATYKDHRKAFHKEGENVVSVLLIQSC